MLKQSQAEDLRDDPEKEYGLQWKMKICCWMAEIF
jgi:hypothetical protein